MALMESIQIADGGDTKKTRDAIPSILEEALSISFDTHIGHDYIEDAEERYEYYHKKESKIAFDIDYLNRITDGGLSAKTLNLLLHRLALVKVFSFVTFRPRLYFKERMFYTLLLKWPRKKIAERIDANLLDVQVQEIKKLSKDQFLIRLIN